MMGGRLSSLAAQNGRLSCEPAVQSRRKRREFEPLSKASERLNPRQEKRFGQVCESRQHVAWS